MIKEILSNIKRSLMGEKKYWIKKGAIIGDDFQTIGNLNLGSEPFLISIGDNVKFSSNCNCTTHDGGMHVIRNLRKDFMHAELFGKITIGNNVFVGMNTSILAGVNIGNNVIIGAGSVVTKNIPSNEIWAGIPAKKITTLNEYIIKNKDIFVMTKGKNSKNKRTVLMEEQIWKEKKF